jgi:hypothetical protein
MTSQKCGLYGPIVHPRVIAMWTMLWWYQQGITPNSSTRALWQPPVAYCLRLLCAHIYLWSEYENGWRKWKRPCGTSRGLQHAVKSYDMGPQALLPIRRKLCWGFVLPLKINRLGWALNPQPLVPLTSTLTTTPPRRHSSMVVSSWDKQDGDREQLYCVAQQCQINSLRFLSYGSCLFSTVWMLESETKVGLERIQTP